MMYSIIRTTPPRPRDPDAEIPLEEWRSYYGMIWTYRLDAHFRANYFRRARRVLGGTELALQFVITLGSAGAVVTLLSKAPTVLAIVASLVVAVCSAMMQVARLSERVRQAAALVESWSARAAYWDEAWTYVRGGQYLGPLHELNGPDVALASAEEALGFPYFDRWQYEIMARVERMQPTEGNGGSGHDGQAETPSPAAEAEAQA